jgi:uncharacterized membrane protein
MSTVEKTVQLNAPFQTVFHYLKDPIHLTAYCEHIIEISSVEPHTSTSVKFHWVYKNLGLRFEGEAVLNYEKEGQQLNIHFWGGIRGSLMWRLHSLGKASSLETFIDYTLPIQILKKHSLDQVLRYTELSVSQAIMSLKAILEAEHA